MFNIEYVASNAIENYPFEIDRHDGSYRYIFFHFTSKVIIKINNETIIANPGSRIYMHHVSLKHLKHLIVV